MVGASQNHQGLFAHFGHLPSPHIEAPETPSFLIGDKGVGCDVGVVKVTRREAGARDEDFTFTTDAKISTKFALKKSSGQKKLNYNPFNCEGCVFFSFSGPTLHIMGPGPKSQVPKIFIDLECIQLRLFPFRGHTYSDARVTNPINSRLLHQVRMLQTQPAIRIRPRPLFEVPPADTERWKMEVLRMETRLMPTRYTYFVITFHLSSLICLSSEFPKESLHNIYSISHEVSTDLLTSCHRTSHLHPINGSAARYGRRCCRVALQVLLGQRRAAGVARHFRGAVEVQDAAAGQKPKQLLEEWSSTNCWFGARWFGFLGSPYESDCY